MSNPPKPLSLGGGAPRPPQGGGTPPPPLTLGATPRPPQAPPARAAGLGAPPPPLALGARGAAPTGGPVQALIESALAADPSLQAHRHRLMPRAQVLASATEAELLCYGEVNLQILQTGSAALGTVTNRLSQLAVSEWTRKCLEASTRVPSWTDVLRAALPTAKDYTARMAQLRTELQPMLATLSAIREELEPDALDLRLDAAMLLAAAQGVADSTRVHIMQGRARTLVTGQQTVAQLLLTLDNTRAAIVRHIQQIDQLMAVTLPAWRTAEANR